MKKTLIERIEVGAGGAASIEFTSIPQDGVDLVVKLSLRSERADTEDALFLVANAGGTYQRILLRGDGSAVTTTSGTTAVIGYTTGANATSNTFSNISVYVSNYASAASTSISIDGVSENNGTAARQSIVALNETTSSAITSLGFEPNVGPNFIAGSTASLYKISA